MIQKIFHTIFSRGFTLAAGFVMVFLTARLLGADIRGEIGLLTFALSIVAAVSGIVGGPVMVYQASRISAARLTAFTLGWSIIVSLVLPPLLVAIELIPGNLLWHTSLLGFLLSVFSGYAGIALGQKKLSTHNYINLAQAFLLPLAFLFFYLAWNEKSIDSYLYALYISYGAPALFSLLRLLGPFRNAQKTTSASALPAIFKQGTQIQLASLFQLISYRSAFYFLERFYEGHEAVGIFSVAVALGEAAWIISKSLATIQYSQVSASRDEKYNRKLTASLLKISLGGTAILCLFLLLLPVDFFTFLFGDEFISVPGILPFLVPGIIFMAAATILTHYFSGKAKNTINIYASFAGAIAAIATCYWLIPAYGLSGAAAATSIGYLVNLLTLSVFYLRTLSRSSDATG